MRGSGAPIRNRSPSSVHQPGFYPRSIGQCRIGADPDRETTVPPAENALHELPFGHAGSLPRLTALPARHHVDNPGQGHSRPLGKGEAPADECPIYVSGRFKTFMIWPPDG